MGKLGRKRKFGHREPGGRISRAAAARVRREVAKKIDPADSPAALKRVLDAQIATVSGKSYGTPVGRLFLAGKDGGVTPVQFYAALRWERLVDQAALVDLFVANHPAPAQAHAGLQSSAGRLATHTVGDRPRPALVDEFSEEERDEWQRQISKSISDALESVRKIGKSAERTLRECCEGGGRNPQSYEELIVLRLCLDALASTWGLTAKRLNVRKAPSPARPLSPKASPEQHR